MSKYKPLYSSIWTDNQFENYSPEKKLVYIFLLTNQYVERSGIYKVSVRQIAFNCNVSANLINEIINEFINEGKLQYDFNQGIIFIKNLFKYQKGMIKNESILLLTLKRNYELVKTEFWNEFFSVYSNDPLITKINGLLIDGSLMAHQLYINIHTNKDINNNKGVPKTKKIILEDELIAKPKKGFTRPTLKEVEDYCQSRTSSVTPRSFFDYYTAGNWKDRDGGQVKNWKQKLLSWEGRNTKGGATQITELDPFVESLNQLLGEKLIQKLVDKKDLVEIKLYSATHCDKYLKLGEAMHADIKAKVSEKFGKLANINY